MNSLNKTEIPIVCCYNVLCSQGHRFYFLLWYLVKYSSALSCVRVGLREDGAYAIYNAVIWTVSIKLTFRMFVVIMPFVPKGIDFICGISGICGILKNAVPLSPVLDWGWEGAGRMQTAMLPYELSQQNWDSCYLLLYVLCFQRQSS